MLRSEKSRKLLSKVAGIAVLLAGGLLAASLCYGAPGDPSPVPSIFDPRSTPTKSIYDLSHFVLSITGLIFVVVFALLTYVVVKYRKREGDDGREPAQVYGSTQIELAWTVIPILIVVVLFLATARVIHSIQDAPKPETAVDVVVIVGISLSTTRRRHCERAAHSGKRSRPSYARFFDTAFR